ncbi:hypothetical protein ACTFIW_010889 [Dictyostelium discoideum]
MEQVVEFLENCDLYPKLEEKKKNSRNPLSGIITIIYLPLLIFYLWFSIRPQYGALPNCCACAAHSTPKESWIYEAIKPECMNSTSCRENVQKQLSLNCDATLQYLPIPDVNLTMNIAEIGCLGLKPGDSCNEECLAVSNRWITSLDYTNPDNQYQAIIRCPLQIGVCDFKAVYSNQETAPHAVCRYPELNGLLIILGSGLSLLNGFLITLRIMLRTFWSRIGANNTKNGRMGDYWKGVVIGVVFNYFGILYLSLAKDISKRMRYGGQLSIGFLLLFFKSPLVIYLMAVFSSFWTPMGILLGLGFIAVSIIIRTVFNLVILEIRSRNCVVLSQGSIEQFGIIGEDSEESKNDNPLRYYQQPDRIKPVPYTTWKDFFTGFYMNLFAIILLHGLKKSYKRYSGLKNGFYVSIGCSTMIIVWVLLWSLNGWDYITYNFPFPLLPNLNKSTTTTTTIIPSSSTSSTSPSLSPSPSSSSSSIEYVESLSTNELMKIAFLQSIYYVISWAIAMMMVFHFSLFLKYLPVNQGVNFFRFLKKKHGTRMDYRFGFIVGIIPVVLTSFFFFYFFFYPYVEAPLPSNPSLCSFPAWTLIIPCLGLIPSMLMFIFSPSERFRSGIISAIGVSILFFGMGSTLLLLNYCLGPNQDKFNPLAWLITLFGSFIIVFGSIRSDTILILDKKKENPRFIEEERLLSSSTQIKNIIEDSIDYNEIIINNGSQNYKTISNSIFNNNNNINNNINNNNININNSNINNSNNNNNNSNNNNIPEGIANNKNNYNFDD